MVWRVTWSIFDVCVHFWVISFKHGFIFVLSAGFSHSIFIFFFQIKLDRHSIVVFLVWFYLVFTNGILMVYSRWAIKFCMSKYKFSFLFLIVWFVDFQSKIFSWFYVLNKMLTCIYECKRYVDYSFSFIWKSSIRIWWEWGFDLLPFWIS